MPPGPRVGESGEVVIAAARGPEDLPLSYTASAGNRVMGDEDKSSEIPRVMGSVLMLEGWVSGIEVPFLGEDEIGPRSVSSPSDRLGRLRSPYEGLVWLERLCGAFQLSQDEGR